MSGDSVPWPRIDGRLLSADSVEPTSNDAAMLHVFVRSVSSERVGAVAATADDDDNNIDDEEGTRVEYWSANGTVPLRVDILNLLYIAERSEVRHVPISPRVGKVTFPFDSPRSRARLRSLLSLNEWLPERISELIEVARERGDEKLTIPALTRDQYELARDVCQIAGFQTYALCTQQENIKTCSDFVPLDKPAGCGCQYVPAAAWSTTARFTGAWNGRSSTPPSAELLRDLRCTIPTENRMIAYSEMVVDGIVIQLEHRTPRTPRDASVVSPPPKLLRDTSGGRSGRVSAVASRDDDNNDKYEDDTIMDIVDIEDNDTD